jgi:hypothetical protein
MSTFRQVEVDFVVISREWIWKSYFGAAGRYVGVEIDSEITG